MFVAADGQLAGLLGVADPIKETTPTAIRELHSYECPEIVSMPIFDMDARLKSVRLFAEARQELAKAA